MTVYSTEDIARVCHAANQEIQAANGEDVAPPWSECDQIFRNSVMQGVLRTYEGATPESLHRSWVEFKVNNGWTWGAVKSDANKTHPQLVPYAELPRAQRIKDHVFLGIVHAFMVNGDGEE